MSYCRWRRNECGDCDNRCKLIRTFAGSSNSNRTEEQAAEKWIEFKENMMEKLKKIKRKIKAFDKR